MFDSTQIINKVTYNGTSISFPSYNASAPLLEMILDNTINTATDITLSGIKYIKVLPFYNPSQTGPQVQTLNLPDCEYLGTSVALLSRLTTLNAPKLRYLSQIGGAVMSCPITNYSFSTVIDIYANQFCLGNNYIQTINLPKLSQIDGTSYGQYVYAVFNMCNNLTSIYFNGLQRFSLNSAFISACPRVETIELNNLEVIKCSGNFIYSVPTLTSLNLPNLTTITGASNSATYYAIFVASCPNLISISLPNVKAITSNNHIVVSVGITELNLPNCSIVNGMRFCTSCPNLTTLYMPKCNYFSIASYGISNCPNFSSLVLGSQLSVFNAQSCFQNCTMLSSISFPNTLSSISGQYIFNNCTSLSQIILYGKTNIQNSNIFTNTPLANSTYLGYFGSIYVPSEYVDWYKSATFWSFYSDRITSLENLGG